MLPALRHAAGLLALVAAPALLGAAAVRQVAVGPAPVERAAQVVTLTLPRELAAGAILRDARGQIVPLQIEPDLSAKFIVVRQAAGETLRFTLEAGRPPEQGNVQVVEEPTPPRPGATAGIAAGTNPSLIQAKTGRLRVSVGGRAILYYQMDRDAVPREDIDPKWRRAGFLHPVLTPAGFVVTEGFRQDSAPHEQVYPGITTRGPLMGRDDRPNFDFDNLGAADATFEFGGIDNTWSGPVHGGFSSWQRWIADKGPDAVLVNESWELTAYVIPKSVGEINVFDLTVVQTNSTAISVNLLDRGLRVNGAAGWRTWPTEWPRPIFTEMPDKEKQLRWIGLTGNGKDRPAGIAVLIPVSDVAKYNASPLQPSLTTPGDSLTLAPNARAKLSYRIVVFDGPTDLSLLEALWNGYTVPAVMTVTPAER